MRMICLLNNHQLPQTVKQPDRKTPDTKKILHMGDPSTSQSVPMLLSPQSTTSLCHIFSFLLSPSLHSHNLKIHTIINIEFP